MGKIKQFTRGICGSDRISLFDVCLTRVLMEFMAMGKDVFAKVEISSYQIDPFGEISFFLGECCIWADVKH